MTGRAKGGSRFREAGPMRPVQPILVCVIVCVLAYQTKSCTGQCANEERPNMMRIRRRHLNEMSAIASDILGEQVIIPNSYTDTQLLTLLDTMRDLSPRAVMDFEESIGDEFTRALDAWIWMCRAQQTLGKRRKRDNTTDNSA